MCKLAGGERGTGTQAWREEPSTSSNPDTPTPPRTAAGGCSEEQRVNGEPGLAGDTVDPRAAEGRGPDSRGCGGGTFTFTRV